MANGSPSRPSTSGVFSGLLLIIFGFLLLLHNYGRLDLGGVFRHWWPLIFIFWGGAKLYERTLAQRQGRTAGWITPGERYHRQYTAPSRKVGIRHIYSQSPSQTDKAPGCRFLHGGQSGAASEGTLCGALF